MRTVQVPARTVVVIAAVVVGQWALQPVLASRVTVPTAQEVAAASQQMGWTPASDSRALALDIFQRVNDERAARGAPPLRWDENLTRLAEGWSERMIESGDYEHSPPSYRIHPAFSGMGENIHMQTGSASETHVDWMESEGHRHNILDADYDAVGIGIVCRNDGLIWGTQIFGVDQDRVGPRPPVDVGAEPVVRRDAGAVCPQAGALADKLRLP